MTILLVLIFMIFFHILEDFHLQGILASMKQKKWWKENAPQTFYEDDYIVALIMHSFSWATMIFIPVFIYRFYMGVEVINFWVLILFIISIIVHAVVDDAKANKFSINLVCDQMIHMAQIIFVWLWTVAYVTI